MKVSIDCKNADQAKALKDGLSDPVAKAVVMIIGYLSVLPDKKDRIKAFNKLAKRLNVKL